MTLSSDRDRLIGEIARRLSTKKWDEIETTLNQFGFPEVGLEGRVMGDELVVKTIESAQDEDLIRLGADLGCELSTQEPDPSCWDEGLFRLFISHVAKHREFAHAVRSELRTYGISAFVAHDAIEPTEEWQRVIESALSTCHCLLALLHPEFQKSKWTDQEIGHAAGRNLLIVPVQLGVDPYGLIGKFQAIRGTTKSCRELAENIFDTVNRHPKTGRTLAESVVNYFGSSSCFAEANERMVLLNELDYWDDHITRLARSFQKSNDQVRRAYKVKSDLKSRIERVRGEYTHFR